MIYIITITALLIILLVFSGLIYALLKLPRRAAILSIILLIGVPLTAFKVYEKKWILLCVPDALDVKTIQYRKEESWGFGPGGNEAGIRVYRLPEHTANQIIEKGIHYFESLPPNTKHRVRDRWRGEYGDWNKTPIVPTRNWIKNQNHSLDIYDYICKYGFCIDIKDEITKEANLIINSTGSYYAYSRIGVMVVSPERKLILYLYNG